MRTVSDEVVEKIKTHILGSIIFFFENPVVYEIMWKNTVQLNRPYTTIWRTHIHCWITKATNIHSGYEILISFPHQQWLRERASMLGYTYIASLVYVYCHWPNSSSSSFYFTVYCVKLIYAVLTIYIQL